MALYVERRFVAKETRLGATKGKVYECKDYDGHISWVDNEGNQRHTKKPGSEAYKNMGFIKNADEELRNMLLKGGVS